jgi:hypothetical protein
MKKFTLIVIAILITSFLCVGGVKYAKETIVDYQNSVSTTSVQSVEQVNDEKTQDDVFSQANNQIDDTVDKIDSVKTTDKDTNSIKSSISNLLNWYNKRILHK